MTIFCQMDFRDYPMDSQTCFFRMGSSGFKTKKMILNPRYIYDESKQTPLAFEVFCDVSQD